MFFKLLMKAQGKWAYILTYPRVSETNLRGNFFVIQESANFFCKRSDSKYFRFRWPYPVSVAYSWRGERGCFLNNPLKNVNTILSSWVVHKQAMGWIWSTGHSLASPCPKSLQNTTS